MRLLGAAALSLSLLLAACTSTPTTQVDAQRPGTTAPATPLTLGRVEVSFTGIGTQFYTSSVRSLDSALSAQALTQISQGLQLRFNSKGSFDVGTAGNGMRYLYATYDVRNAGVDGVASNAARSNLTFVAVDASSPETISGTAVRNFKRFDGSAADVTLAPKIIPTVGMTSVNGTPTVNPSQADLQALTTTEASSIGLPTGVRDVFQYGYVVRNRTGGRTLPANPGANQYDGLVTFAVKLPLQANPTNDPYSFSLVFEVVADSANRVTRVPEETVSQAQGRATALGASLVDANTICQVRVAGSANSPTTVLNGLGVTSTPAGGRDVCFGTNGQVITSVGSLQDLPRAMTIQPDGKIVAAGQSVQSATGIDLALIRYQTDGTLDPSFGTGGIVTTAVGGGTSGDFTQAIVRQPDGKLVVAGSSTNVTGTTGTDMLLARYNTNGTLDTSFGTGGTVLLAAGPSNNNDFAFGLDIQSDGKLVIAGYTGKAPNNTEQDIVVARFLTTGVLDSTFGTGGIVTTAIGTGTASDRAQDIQVQPDGKLVVLGTVVTGGSTGNDTVVLRYNTNGTLDSSFGSGGKVVTAVGPDNGGASADIANALVLLPDGKIVAAGGSNNLGGSTGQDISLVKYNANGSLDTSFGTGGKVFTPMVDGAVLDVANAIQVQADGKLVVSGTSQNTGAATGQDFAVVRYNSNGSLDTTFAGTGKTLIPVGSGSASDISTTLQIQSDGKIVLAGSTFLTGSATSTDFGLVRLQP